MVESLDRASDRDPDRSITWTDRDDRRHVWVSPAELAKAWWDESIIRQSELRFYGAAQACVADLLDHHHPTAVDLLRALVAVAASPDELDFLVAVIHEDAMTDPERQAWVLSVGSARSEL